MIDRHTATTSEDRETARFNRLKDFRNPSMHTELTISVIKSDKKRLENINSTKKLKDTTQIYENKLS